MMGSLPENAPTIEEAEQDSEWEYEYHETETEVSGPPLAPNI